MAERREELEIEAEEAREQANPAAVAIALGRASHASTEVDAEATAFLRKQSRLADLQMENLHEQRDLQLAHLKVRRWKDRLSIAAQALGIAVGAIAVTALGVMVWQAHEDRGLVVEAFSVPPDLAQRGLTGQVAASKVLDKLANLQATTDSARAPNTYSNNWGDDIKVEIPDTGVSIGQLSQYLRQWLGHQTHISGEVVRTPTGVAVTARTAGEPGDTFEGPEADLDKLFQQAAEAVYRHTQPYRYGAFLMTHGRIPEARPVFEALQVNGEDGEAKWAELGLANTYYFAGDILTAERAHLELARHYPRFIMSTNNVAGDASLLDHEEEMLAAERQSVPLFQGGANKDVTLMSGRVMAKSTDAGLAELLGDFQLGARLEGEEMALPDYGGSSAGALLSRAIDLAFDHQPSASARAIADARPPPGILPIYFRSFAAQVDGARMLNDVVAENWKAAIDEGARLAPLTTTAEDPFLRYQIARQFDPWLAYAMARAGDQAGAEALVAQTPTDSDTALRMRGKIAAVKGDWAGAEGWFAKTVRQAPSIPFAYADWGEMLMAKGDVAGAIAKLEIAHAKGPHYADALELWGEALMRKGDFAGAAVKFAEADKYAPGWERNRVMWRQALARTKTHG